MDDMHKEASIETYRAATREDWPEWEFGSLVISHDGTGWNGTFELVARTALRDVLEDGPLDDVVIVEEARARGLRNIWRGTVESVTDSEVAFYGGASVEIDRVLAVSF
jgi:hypothetical protein